MREPIMENENLEIEKVEETAEAEIVETNEEAEEILNESEETEEAVEGESDTTEDIDYDAELEALKKNKATNFENAKKRIEAKEKTTDKEALKAEIRNELIADLQKDLIEEELGAISNDKKRELVKYHYENSIVKSGSSKQAVREDIAKAIAITDALVNAKRKSENLIAKSAKETVTTGSSKGGKPSNTAQESRRKVLSPSDIAFGEKRGWTKEMFERAAADIKSKK